MNITAVSTVETTGLRVNCGCGAFSAFGWTNLDVVHLPELDINPDVIQPDPLTLPLDDATVGMAYVGHLLEHIAWQEVPTYLAEIRRVLIPGTGQICVVGPDWRRTLTMWKRNEVDFTTVEAVLEGRDEGTGAWDAARHRWNCDERRLVEALTDAGFVDVKPVEMASRYLDPWPVTSRVRWQCAVLARAPAVR